MDPFLDYLPEPPDLEIINGKIDSLDRSIECIKRLIDRGDLRNSVSFDYLRGIREVWDRLRRTEAMGYLARLSDKYGDLNQLLADMEYSIAKIREENHRIPQEIADQLQAGIDGPILFDCDEEHLAILESRIERIRFAVESAEDSWNS